jgi:ribonuclease HI
VIKGWAKPPESFVKLNVDASFDADDLQGTTGAIIRDCKGTFVAASNSKIDFIHDVMSAEIHALKGGLTLAQSMGCNRVICYDNMDVIQAMTEGGFSNGADFVKIQFEHTFRESNRVAHELARLAREHEHNVWLDDRPTSIILMLIKGVTLLLLL